VEEGRAIGEVLGRDIRLRSPWLWDRHARHRLDRTRALPNGDRVWITEMPLTVHLYSGTSVRELTLPPRERSSGASMKVFDWGAATGLLENDRVLYRLAPDGTITLLADDLVRSDVVGHADSVWVTRGACGQRRATAGVCWHGPHGERTLRGDPFRMTPEYADAEAVLVRVQGRDEAEEHDELLWLGPAGETVGELVAPFDQRPVRRAADGTRWTTSRDREPSLWVQWPGTDFHGEELSLPPGTRATGVVSQRWVVAAGPTGVHVGGRDGRWERVDDAPFDETGTFSLSCTELGCWLPDGRWVAHLPERIPAPIPGIQRERPPHEIARNQRMRCERVGDPRIRQPALERETYPAITGLTRAWDEADGGGTRFAWQIGTGPVHRSRPAAIESGTVVDLRVYAADEERALVSYCDRFPECDAPEKLLVRRDVPPLPLELPPETRFRAVLPTSEGGWFVLLYAEKIFVWAQVAASGSVIESHRVPADSWTWVNLGRHRGRVALTVGRAERERVLVREIEGADRRVTHYDTDALERCGPSPGVDRLWDVSARYSFPFTDGHDRVFNALSVTNGRACLIGGGGYYARHNGAPPFTVDADGGFVMTWASGLELQDYRCTP
jgi:hypothetical protein